MLPEDWQKILRLPQEKIGWLGRGVKWVEPENLHLTLKFLGDTPDHVLPDVENGNITFIGATTENPFFSVVAPLLSRSQIFEFRRLEEAALAAEQAQPEESGGMFGSIMGAVSELGAMAGDFGLIGGVDPVTIVYSPDASAADVAAAAEKMGVTSADIERCRQP